MNPMNNIPPFGTPNITTIRRMSGPERAHQEIIYNRFQLCRISRHMLPPSRRIHVARTYRAVPVHVIGNKHLPFFHKKSYYILVFWASDAPPEICQTLCTFFAAHIGDCQVCLPHLRGMADSIMSIRGDHVNDLRRKHPAHKTLFPQTVRMCFGSAVHLKKPYSSRRFIAFWRKPQGNDIAPHTPARADTQSGTGHLLLLVLQKGARAKQAQSEHGGEHLRKEAFLLPAFLQHVPFAELDEQRVQVDNGSIPIHVELRQFQG